MRSLPVLVSFAALIAGIFYLHPPASPDSRSTVLPSTDAAVAHRLLHRQPGLFVPNVGQWDHRAKFVYRNGPMTLFVQDRGWIMDLTQRTVKPNARRHELGCPSAQHPLPGEAKFDQKIRGVAVQMTFEGDGHVPEIVGEKKSAGHHNYFLGNDESRWRTEVPIYGSVRYEGLYAGIDLRLREMDGVPEYDLLLQPGADLSLVTVHVEGGQGLSIAGDGSLVIETVLGPLTQSTPKTWQLDHQGEKQQVLCNFTLLGADRFGFAAPGWDGDTSLTIDPGLIWSTFLGGSGVDHGALSVDASGVVTVAGGTFSTNFPTTTGAYDTTFNGSGSFPSDAFVCRLDPSKTGKAQLIYSTFLGGNGGQEGASALFVDASGVVTVAGSTDSTNFPWTSGTYDTTHNGGSDGFVSRLDPSKTGKAQLVYSTFLGGSSSDSIAALSVDASSVVTVAGFTRSTNFPTTSGAYDRTFNGGNDTFVSRLDPSKTGKAQLVYSTFLGGSRGDPPNALSVDASGVMTVAGYTNSTNFPWTTGAYNTTYNGSDDGFVSRLDPSKTGTAQLVYSTFLGGSSYDYIEGLSVDTSGVVTVAGLTVSTNFPSTPGAYNTTHNGGSSESDGFVSRLDPSKTGAAQLVYSTFLGGSSHEFTHDLSVDASGVVTVAGGTWSTNFPRTPGAYDTTHNGGRDDAFVCRLDPRKTGKAQLVYSTFLGGNMGESVGALSVNASGVVTVAGRTGSTNFPWTTGAYDTTYNGGGDAFVSRLDMGVALYGDVHAIPIKTGGTQKLTVNAGKTHANRLYWIFGSVTGTAPGVNLLGVHIPLNPDVYTDVAMAAVNTTVFTKFKGTLDANGLAAATFNVPATLAVPSGFTFHHAYVVYDASGTFFMASNPVPLNLK